MTKTALEQLTLSVRLIWPVARALEGNPLGNEMLARLGITPAEFVDPETRLPVSLAFAQLDALAARLDDPTIGLRSGETVDFADFDILEHAARSTANLGEAQAVMWRYMGLMNDALRASATVHGEMVHSHYGWVPGLQVSSTVNDFSVAAALGFSRRNMLSYAPPTEVHLAHARPAYAAAYTKAFECPVVFDAPCNTIVMTQARVNAPMRAPSPALSEAFQAQAERLLRKMQGTTGTSGRVQADVAAHLGGETVSMEMTAKRLALGVATLRRKLQEEGTTFSEIVDDLRRGLAETHLKQRTSAVSEVAFLLGFSDVRAFGRAFKRWTKVSPKEYRARKH